jgi:methyl coenzyme M reductase gamma subunit
MQSEDQYMERTPDLVAKVRAMRVAAEKEMNRFTRVADYDVRRVVGHRPQAAPVSDETVVPSSAAKRAKKGVAKSAIDQVSMDFPPAPAERGDDGEDA